MLTLSVSDCVDATAGQLVAVTGPVMARLHDGDDRAAVPAPVTVIGPLTARDFVVVAAELPLMAQVDGDALVVALRHGWHARRLATLSARYGVRWVVAPRTGAHGYVAVAVHPVRQQLDRLRKDLFSAGLGSLIVPTGTWVPAIGPTADGEVLALGAIQDRPHVVRSYTTPAVLAGWLGHPQVADEHDPAPRAGVWRAADPVVDLVCRLYLRGSAIPLALTQDERVDRCHAPWGTWWTLRRALQLGIPVTVLPQPDVVAGDGDTWTAIAAFHTVAERHGIAVLASWSGRPGHLTMAARVDQGSRRAFADLVHAEEARLCAENGLPTPDRQVVRYREHSRPLTGGSAKRGAQVGAALLIVLGATEEGVVVEPIDAFDAGQALGFGQPATIIRDHITLVKPAKSRAPRRPRRPVPVVATEQTPATTPATSTFVTPEAFAAAWGLINDGALALTLPQAELIHDGGTSHWVWQLLWQLVARPGATVDTAVQALELSTGLLPASGYKTKARGTEGLRSRLQWEWDRAVLKRAEEDARRRAEGGTTTSTGAVVDGPARLAARAEVEQALAATWASLTLDPRELVTWAVAAHWAQRCVTTTVGLDTRRWAIGLGVSQGTISARVDALLWTGAVKLTQREGQDAEGSWESRRYILDTTAGSPIARRASLATVNDLLIKHTPHLPGMSAEALLILATLTEAQQTGERTRVRDLAGAWGMSPARVRRALLGLEELGLLVRWGQLLGRSTTTLQSVLVAHRAADRWATRDQARQDELAAARQGTEVPHPEPAAAAPAPALAAA